MGCLDRLALVLNATYEPLNVCSARRALVLVLKGIAVEEEVSAYTVHTGRRDIPLPRVIRLRCYRKMPRINRSVSRKGIMLRDRSMCQYCGRKLPSKDLTMDHVTPRSRGGESTWENLASCCFLCNNRKANRTPQEAGMVLVKRPIRIGIHAKHRLMADDQATWEKYLFV